MKNETMTAETRAADAIRAAGEDRRAYLFAEIERQRTEDEARALQRRAGDIAEARREDRRARAAVQNCRDRIREARRDGDNETAAALEARLDDYRAAAEETRAALLEIDPRARMTAPDFLQLSERDPETAAAAIAAAVYSAAKVKARNNKTAAADLVARYGEDARQQAYCDALEQAAESRDPLALFLCRIAGNALSREMYAGAAAVDGLEDSEYHAAGKTPGPEAATIAAEKLPRALSKIREDNGDRETAATIAAALAAGYTLKEAAAALRVSPARVTYALDALRAAAEIVRAEDGEAARLEHVRDLDRHAAAMLEKEARAAAARDLEAALNVAAMERAERGTAPAPAVTWTAPRPAVIREFSGLSYLERVIYSAANQAALKALFSEK